MEQEGSFLSGEEQKELETTSLACGRVVGEAVVDVSPSGARVPLFVVAIKSASTHSTAGLT